MAVSPAVDARVAFSLAKKIVAELAPACDRIEIAGSLRRNRPQVHDIDIVGLPSGDGSVWRTALENMVTRGSLIPVRRGDKVQCYIAAKTGIRVDIYRAEQRTWATLLLIRTGSREHNIRLAQRARELGMKLRASGDGIETGPGDVLDVHSEEEIFSLLKLPYLIPEQRS
jgi:DNA polymerase (family 10)